MDTLLKKAFFKLRSKGIDFTDRISANIFGTEMTDKEFFKVIQGQDYKFSSLKELQKYFCERRKPKFFINLSNRGETISIIYKSFPDTKNKTITEADKVCNHIFDFLGSGQMNLGKKINWHHDFKTGYCWNPGKYYKDIKIPYGKADIKIPWELSRFQHLAMLGEAYWLTNDEKYTREFINQIEDWIEDNPPKRGVNWDCTMDVAIRAANWVLGYHFFKDSHIITNNFLIKFLKSLLLHGRHIVRNLENKGLITSNHYLSDIAGLVYLGAMFPEFKEANSWREFGMRELKKEIEIQLYRDGFDFEASTCYHRLVLELFFFSTLLVVMNDSEFDGENYRKITEKLFGTHYTGKLYKMFDVLLHVLKPNGRIPQIGDNDNGRFYIFTKRETLDMRYLLTLGTIFFKESKFKVKEFGFSEEALWIFGKEGYRLWQNLEENNLLNIESYAFPDAGWYVMRSNNNYMIIACGSNGQNGNGGHGHNDKLSFELCVDGEDIIVDPGSYVYTPQPKIRNLFRSTTYHNTVAIDNEEQNRFNERFLFTMGNDSKTRRLRWKRSSEENLFIGEHYGYKRLREPILHRRAIKFAEKETRWKIKDEFYRGESTLSGDDSKTRHLNHKFGWYFHLAPQIIVEQIEAHEFLLRGKNSMLNFKIYNLPSTCNPAIEDSWFSPQYGVKVRNKVLKLEYTNTVPFKLEFEIKLLF